MALLGGRASFMNDVNELNSGGARDADPRFAGR